MVFSVVRRFLTPTAQPADIRHVMTCAYVGRLRRLVPGLGHGLDPASTREQPRSGSDVWAGKATKATERQQARAKWSSGRTVGGAIPPVPDIVVSGTLVDSRFELRPPLQASPPKFEHELQLPRSP